MSGRNKERLTQPAAQSNAADPPKGFLSPFRYPGGKTWFIKTARKWLKRQPKTPLLLVEPFGGGAGISLTAVNEGLVRGAAFAELNPDVGAAWQCMLNGEAGWLSRRITQFKIGRRRVERVLSRKPRSKRDRAFKCLLRNRTARGGVIAGGAGLIRDGEDEQGIGSRWYPGALSARIRKISSLKTKLRFFRSDGFRLIQKHLRRKRAVFFIDPPYTKAARRLYTHWDIDHEKLFKLLSRAAGDVLMTYDDTPEVRKLAKKYRFKVRRISMNTTHHERKRELMISRKFAWLQRVCKNKQRNRPLKV